MICVMLSEPGFTDQLTFTDTIYGKLNIFRNDTSIGASLIAYGEYTQYETNLLSNFIEAGSTVYDIGANIGFKTIGLSVGAKQVYGFEPNYKHYRLLKLNTTELTNVKVFNLAVGNENVTGHIQDMDLSVPGNYCNLKLSDEGQEVSVVKLDDYVKKHNLLQPNIVRIDTYGTEQNVIKGMRQLIKDNMPILMYKSYLNVDVSETYDMLTNMGYKIYWFGVPNYNPNNFKKNAENLFAENSGVVNEFAVPFYVEKQIPLLEKSHRTETYEEAIEKYKKNAKQD